MGSRSVIVGPELTDELGDHAQLKGHAGGVRWCRTAGKL